MSRLGTNVACIFASYSCSFFSILLASGYEERGVVEITQCLPSSRATISLHKEQMQCRSVSTRLPHKQKSDVTMDVTIEEWTEG